MGSVTELHCGQCVNQNHADLVQVAERAAAQAPEVFDTPTVKQDNPWEASAERGSDRRENDGIRLYFNDKEYSVGVGATAANVVMCA